MKLRSHYVAKMTRVTTCLIALLVFIQNTAADATTKPTPQPSPFLIVFIDSRTEKSIGPFPYDRSVLAGAVNQASHLQARAVVLKFFLDQPKSEAGDLALADSMTHIPVLLEACFNNQEKSPNPLPDRFSISGLPNDVHCLSGNTGWLPLPSLSARAADIGFVDYELADHIPAFEQYRGHPVKSLVTCCLELALGKPANIVPEKSLTIADKTISLDSSNQIPINLPAHDNLESVSFIDFINGHLPPETIKDRIVIICYDGQGMPTMNTPVGKLKVHRAFCYGLLAAYEKFEGKLSSPTP